MKPTKRLLPILAAIAASSLPLQAATINLDLTSNNSGNITLGAGSNTFSFTGFEVDSLIVGGGGGGGTPRNNAGRAGGGGGAGGLLEGTTSISGVQSISVGAGGAGGVPGPTGTWQPATNGQNSTAFSFTAIGGGRGGANVTGQDSGNSGGSGGGASSSLNNTGGGAGTAGQGNNGAGGNGGTIGGGGGGAGSAASGQTTGAGLTFSLTGSSVSYAQGGAGVINLLQSNYSITDANADIFGGLILGADTLVVSTYNDGFNDFTQISVIPEPRAAFLGGLGMLLLLRRRRA